MDTGQFPCKERTQTCRCFYWIWRQMKLNDKWSHKIGDGKERKRKRRERSANRQNNFIQNEESSFRMQIEYSSFDLKWKIVNHSEWTDEECIKKQTTSNNILHLNWFVQRPSDSGKPLTRPSNRNSSKIDFFPFLFIFFAMIKIETMVQSWREEQKIMQIDFFFFVCHNLPLFMFCEIVV